MRPIQRTEGNQEERFKLPVERCPANALYNQAGTVMMDVKEGWRTAVNNAEKPSGLGVLICVHVIICCTSLVCVSNFNYSDYFNAATLHIFYDPARFPGAATAVAAFALFSILFVFARFSVGYFIGFYLYTMVLGFL